jgi:hypothetical protein
LDSGMSDFETESYLVPGKRSALDCGQQPRADCETTNS